MPPKAKPSVPGSPIADAGRREAEPRPSWQAVWLLDEMWERGITPNEESAACDARLGALIGSGAQLRTPGLVDVNRENVSNKGRYWKPLQTPLEPLRRQKPSKGF